MTLLINNLLKEIRDPSLTYTEIKVKGVVAKVETELSGNTSGKFTKLAAEYSTLSKQIDVLNKRKAEISTEVKDKLSDLFNAEDEILSRVVKTASATLSLSRVQKTESTDYAAILAELAILVPDISEKVADLTKKYTTTSEKSPQLRISMNEGKYFDAFKSIVSKYFSFIKSWGEIYDIRLGTIEDMISRLT